MKWATAVLKQNAERRLVLVEGDNWVDIHEVYRWYCTKYRKCVEPQLLSSLTSLNALLEAGLTEASVVKDLRGVWLEALRNGDETALSCQLSPVEAQLTLPFQPAGFRDFYAFERHVSTCRAKRGLEMVPEWYEIPVFYFSNPRSFVGTGETIRTPIGCHELDFELEIACVMGKQGSSIPVSEAEDYIAGYAILNDWSARDIQRQELKVGLGPAKGKDFATSLGPYLVTPEELKRYQLTVGSTNGSAARNGLAARSNGSGYDLKMTASVNGKQISLGNFKDIHYTFAEMIERASRDTTLVTGEVLGSGTVGTGCILELGTEVQPWLQPGDEVSLSITELGVLQNSIC